MVQGVLPALFISGATQLPVLSLLRDTYVSRGGS